MKKFSTGKLKINKETVAKLDASLFGEVLGNWATTTLVVSGCFSNCTCPNTE